MELAPQSLPAPARPLPGQARQAASQPNSPAAELQQPWVPVDFGMS
jgi:hypothetical protein